MRTVHTNQIRIVLLISLVVLALGASVFAYPPDPDNAGLLYYQAFLTQKQPDETMEDMVMNLAKGKTAVHDKIAEYVESNRRVIDLVSAAAEIPDCDWGLKYSDGLSMEVPYLSAARKLCWLVLADARILAAKGDNDLALKRCITTQRLAVHVASEPIIINWLVGFSIKKVSAKCIQDILSSGTSEGGKLRWIEAQLDEIEGKGVALKDVLDVEHAVMAKYMTMEKVDEVLPLIEDCMGELNKDKFKIAAERIQTADAVFLKRNRDYFDRHMAIVSKCFDLAYPDGYNRLKELGESPAKECVENPDATLTAVLAPALDKLYNYNAQAKTLTNALKAAVQIYITKASTGELPDELPSEIPGDLFSGEDFEYEKKDDGFILRCGAKDLQNDTIHEYQFKVVE